MPLLDLRNSHKKWTPPPHWFIKVNVDASLLASSNFAGIGVVARDHLGRVIDWRRRRLEHVCCPEIAETLAVVAGIDLAQAKGWMNVILESDCLLVVNDLNSSTLSLSAAGQFIEDSKNRSCFFSSLSFQFVRRSANSLAHVLAQPVDSNSEGSSVLPD